MMMRCPSGYFTSCSVGRLLSNLLIREGSVPRGPAPNSLVALSYTFHLKRSLPDPDLEIMGGEGGGGFSKKFCFGPPGLNKGRPGSLP